MHPGDVRVQAAEAVPAKGIQQMVQPQLGCLAFRVG